MLLHIFQSAFIYIYIYDLITKTGQVVWEVYSLKIPLTLSVGRTCECDGITVKTALADLRESPAGREEANSCERPREQATW